MRWIHLILTCVLILAVVFSGCAGKKSGEPAQKPAKQEPALEGNISVPGEKDLLIEDMQSAQEEAVDLGSLI